MAEILAIMIRNNSNIKGLTLQDSTLKLNQFADDLTCFISEPDSLSDLLATLSKFQDWSGLAINRGKSKILQPGFEDGESLQGIPVVRRIKILGIWFVANDSEEEAYENNFRPILDRIRSICGSWSNRTLSLKGKVTIINSLIASLLQYISLAVHTPSRVFAEYKRLVVKFLWNNKRLKIAYSSLILPTNRGGLKLMDLETRTQVNMIQWIKRVINNPNSSAAGTLRTIIDTSSLNSHFAAKRGPNKELNPAHKFYCAAFIVWDKFHGFELSSGREVRAEWLWQNKRIQSGGRPIRGSSWQRSGINHIADLCHGTNNLFLSHTELSNKFGVQCSFLDLLQVRMSIPLHWRRLLAEAPLPENPPLSDFEIKIQGKELADASSIGAKALYELINGGETTVSTACKRWQEEKEEITLSSPEEWNESCSSVYTATRETKIQSFHYKVLHKILPCGSFLHRVRIRDSAWCEHCDETDSITHYLFTCAKVRPFWLRLCEWFRQEVDLYLDGITPKERDTINNILLSIKFYIFRQKMFHDCELDSRHWLLEFRTKLRTERWIRNRIGSRPPHRIYNRILEAMG